MFFNLLSGARNGAISFRKMPFFYQRWYFTLVFDVPTDNTMNTYSLIAAYTGLNFLKEVVTMPSYGSYVYDEASETYLLASLDPMEEDPSVVDDIALRVNPGPGRRMNSRFELDGLYFFSRPAEGGHYWDARVAMNAMLDARAQQLGVDANADFRTFILPYYLLFPDEMTKLFNGMFMEDYDDIAPRVINGEIQHVPLTTLRAGSTQIDPATGALVDVAQMMNSSQAIDLNYFFAQRIYALLYSTLTFKSQFSLNYIDQARVYKTEGATPIPGDGFETMSCTDKRSGIAYSVLVDMDNAEQYEDLLSYRMIEQCQRLQADLESASDDERGRAQSLFDRHIEFVNMAIAAVDVFGRNFL